MNISRRSFMGLSTAAGLVPLAAKKVVPKFTCMGATTGRFSSKAPNMQNMQVVPKRVRDKMITSSKGVRFMEADLTKVREAIWNSMQAPRYLRNG